MYVLRREMAYELKNSILNTISEEGFPGIMIPNSKKVTFSDFLVF